MRTSMAAFGSRLFEWFDERIGLGDLVRSQLTDYLLPPNINFWYSMGFVTLSFFALQLVTGMLLLIYYTPDATKAFDSVEFIMKNVPYGWLIRYMHAIGSNMMVVVLLLHMLSTLFMASYKRPRELQWMSGVTLFALTLLMCLSGYLLPWSQLSYWATTVATNSLRAIPWIGDELVVFVRGSEGVTNATLKRFFALHVVIIPLIMLGIVGAHLFFMRATGVSEPPSIKGEG
jgi:ubiquinol-cytochrome c reductase cytochrome b subunit